MIRQQLSIWEKTCIPTLLRSWKTGLNTILRKTPRIQPGQGFPRLRKGSRDKTYCTSCGLCEDSCPTLCISISPQNSSEPVQPAEFSINAGSCLGCSVCIDICPEAALIHNPGPLPGAQEKESLLYKKNSLLLSL